MQNRNTSTPYDDAHRTLLNDCPWLIIPVVNEMFQKKHSDKEKITVLNKELLSFRVPKYARWNDHV